MNDFPLSATHFGGKDHQVTVHDILNISSQNVLLSGPDSVNECLDEASVPSAVTTQPFRLECLGRVLSKVRHCVRGHITDNLTMREMKTRLPLANGRAKSYHCEGCGRTVGKLEVHDLVIADVIIAFIDAPTVRSVEKCFRHVLNVRKAIHQRFDGLASVTL